jgi:DNA modification methylase
VTSPPYWGLRDYGEPGQLGLEPTPGEYVARMVEVFREVRRVLRDDGTLWLNLGDSYFGSGKGPTAPTGMHGANGTPVPIRGVYTHETIKPKDLVGIPWRVAFALQDDGWWLRSDIIWAKPNPMPESITDRPTKSHEYVFLLTKSPRYFYDAEAVREESVAVWNAAKAWNGRQSMTAPEIAKGADLDLQRTRGFGTHHEDVDRTNRNARSVWTITTKPYAGAHFATFPPELPSRCIRAGSAAGDLVLDPFSGAATTALVARGLGRRAVGIELNPEYLAISADRLKQLSLFAETS